MNVHPLRNLVVVTLEPEPEPDGLIQVVRQHREPSCLARIDAVGPECREATPGRACVVSRLQGVVLEDGRVVLPDTAILAWRDSQADGDT